LLQIFIIILKFGILRLCILYWPDHLYQYISYGLGPIKILHHESYTSLNFSKYLTLYVHLL